MEVISQEPDVAALYRWSLAIIASIDRGRDVIIAEKTACVCFWEVWSKLVWESKQATRHVRLKGDRVTQAPTRGQRTAAW